MSGTPSRTQPGGLQLPTFALVPGTPSQGSGRTSQASAPVSINQQIGKAGQQRVSESSLSRQARLLDAQRRQSRQSASSLDSTPGASEFVKRAPFNIISHTKESKVDGLRKCALCPTFKNALKFKETHQKQPSNLQDHYERYHKWTCQLCKNSTGIRTFPTMVEANDHVVKFHGTVR